MSFAARARLVNPRLGTYFSIFAALFAALFLLVLIFEQLNIGAGPLRLLFFVAPLIAYACIGLSTTTNETIDFFAAGRRVPASYTGLVLAVSALGATFVVAGTGCFFFAGFDAIVLMMGGLSGFVAMAMLLAPFYRKFGAYTVPSFIGRRFENTALRIAAAMVAAVPILLVLSAELSLASSIGGRLTGVAPNVIVPVLVGLLTVVLAPGGKRSFTWTATVQSIAVLMAMMICVTSVSYLVTSLPVPQLAHGPLVRGLVRSEIPQGLQVINTWPMAFDLPREGFQIISKPYTQPFGSVGMLGFILGTLTIACGTAAAPWLLPRVAATPSVYEARKSLGWATVFFGFTMLTLSSIAVFMRDFALDAVISDRIGPLPQWLAEAARFNFLSFDSNAARLSYSDLQFDRDAVLFALPLAAQLPLAFTYLMLAGGLAAALVAAGATVVSLAAILGEDVVQGMTWEPSSKENRIWLVRGFVFIAATCGGAMTVLAPTDPLKLVLWALGLTTASLFPILILSIWWKRVTSAGALFGLISGFVTAALAIFAGEAGVIPVPGALAASFGLPICTLVAIAISLARPEASRHALEVVRDIRVPGGEIIYDREMQRLQLKRTSRQA